MWRFTVRANESFMFIHTLTTLLLNREEGYIHNSRIDGWFEYFWKKVIQKYSNCPSILQFEYFWKKVFQKYSNRPSILLFRFSSRAVKVCINIGTNSEPSQMIVWKCIFRFLSKNPLKKPLKLANFSHFSKFFRIFDKTRKIHFQSFESAYLIVLLRYRTPWSVKV